MTTYLTKEQILERIQALPKKSKYLTREEINQRMNLACELGLFTKNLADLNIESPLRDPRQRVRSEWVRYRRSRPVDSPEGVLSVSDTDRELGLL